jgi:hypothetical protein
MDPLGADTDKRLSSKAWPAFLGGIAILTLSILTSIGIWHFAGNGAAAMSAGELTEIEALLDQLGFPPGPVDGSIDEQSRNAIRDFQLTAGLDVDGAPSLALLGELRAAKAELN